MDKPDKMLTAQDHMSQKPYFPPLYGNVECEKCEIKTTCWCCGKYQRNRRDFTHTSGRCPRLPDRRGFVEKSERELYAATFLLVHAERGEEALRLTLNLPGERRNRKVYCTKSGYFYYRVKNGDGYFEKKVIHITGAGSKKEIMDYMKMVDADYCIFRCEKTDYLV